MTRLRTAALAFFAVFAASGCAYQTSPNVYDPYTAGQLAYTQMGTVRSSRTVEIQNNNPGGTGIGTMIGSLAGGVAGSFIGPDSYSHRGHKHYYTSASSVAGALGGAILGGILGSVIERDVSRQLATEYVVQMDDGQLISIVQGSQPMMPGQRVFVHTPNSGRARIVPAA